MDKKVYSHTLTAFNNANKVGELKWTSLRKQKKVGSVLTFKDNHQLKCNVITFEYIRTHSTNGVEITATVIRTWGLTNDNHFESTKRAWYCRGHIDKGTLVVSGSYSSDFKCFEYCARWHVGLFSDRSYDSNIGIDGKHPVKVSHDFRHKFPKIAHDFPVYHWLIWEKAAKNVELLVYLLENSSEQHVDSIHYDASIDVLELLKAKDLIHLLPYSNFELAAAWGLHKELEWCLENISGLDTHMNLTLFLKKAKNWHSKDRDNSKLIDYLESRITLSPYRNVVHSNTLEYEKCVDTHQKILYIKSWFEIPLNDIFKYFGRGIIGNSGLFSLSGALTLCAKWENGTDICNVSEDTVNYVFNHPVLKEYRSITECKAYS